MNNTPMLMGKIPEDYYPLPHPSWDNIFWQSDVIKRNYEGMYYRVSLKKVKRDLIIYYGLNPEWVSVIIGENRKHEIKISFLKIMDKRGIVDEALKLCGFYTDANKSQTEVIYRRIKR